MAVENIKDTLESENNETKLIIAGECHTELLANLSREQILEILWVKKPEAETSSLPKEDPYKKPRGVNKKKIWVLKEFHIGNLVLMKSIFSIINSSINYY